MEITVQERAGSVTLGPVLFNWQPESWRDFYFRIADEAPVSTVYLGETVCSKRAPLIEPHYEAVADRLSAAGKTVVFSTLSEVVSKLDRKLAEQICTAEDFLVEANDGSALLHLKGRPHHIGPLMNVYNERTVAFLAGNGAQNVCLPVEMPATAVAALCQATRDLDDHDRSAGIRAPIAGAVGALLSRARPWPHQGQLPLRLRGRSRRLGAEHARRPQVSHRQRHPDPVLRISQSDREVPALRAMGVSRFRLSPHSLDMVEVATIFAGVVDGRLATDEAAARLEAIKPAAPFANGFYYGKPGYTWNSASAV